MPTFSNRSKQNLSSCREPLIELFTEVIKVKDCSVLCGYRNKHDQELAFAQGNSKVHYPKSRHNQHPSFAVDVMAYPIKWDDRLGQHEFATYVYNKAMEMGISVRWGGQFKGHVNSLGHYVQFYDAPHWELINV